MAVEPTNPKESSNPAGSSPQEKMLDMASSFVLSQAILVVNDLGIADILRGGPRKASELAAACGAHEQALFRILRFLASRGIFEETKAREFKITPLAEVLQRDAPGSIHKMVRMIDSCWWQSCGNLGHTIRTGESAFCHTFGQGFFDYLADNPESNERFNVGLSAASTFENADIVEVYDFDRYENVVDVGGGQGSLLAKVLTSNTSVTGVLYDQPHVVADTELKKAGVSDRCEIIGGNFLEEIPSGKDLYVLKKILHDWSDEVCLLILKNCRRAIKGRGRLLIIDTVVPPGNERHHSKDADVLMMLLATGRERTESEFRELYQAAGFELTRVLPTNTALSLIEGEAVG